MWLAGYWPADHLDVLDHALHANSALVDRVDFASPLSLSSRSVTSLSALAPAQRAGAQRLCALASNGPRCRGDQRLLVGVKLTQCGGLLNAGPMIEPYKELRNSSRALRSLRDNLLKRAVMSRASPAWRRMASSRVSVAPSCISRERRRTPHSGAVRTLNWVLSKPRGDRFFHFIV